MLARTVLTVGGRDHIVGCINAIAQTQYDSPDLYTIQDLYCMQMRVADVCLTLDKLILQCKSRPSMWGRRETNIVLLQVLNIATALSADVGSTVQQRALVAPSLDELKRVIMDVVVLLPRDPCDPTGYYPVYQSTPYTREGAGR
jgi:hypothetical protein